MKIVTYGDSIAAMILAAHILGMEPNHVKHARSKLEGKTIHPIDAASMERTALEINNEIRGDLQLVARANELAKQYLKDHGFSVDDGVPS